MISAFLKRKYKEGQTLGELTVIQNEVQIYSCKTVELKWNSNRRRLSCIPVGVYDVIKRFSPKHGDHFHITNVPERSWILIHSANFSRELLGCIAPGKDHIDLDKDGLIDVSSSKLALEELNAILPVSFKLTIT